MIDGEFYVTRGQVMTMAEEEIMECFRSTHAKFFENGSAVRPVSVPSAEGDTLQTAGPKILPFAAAGRSSYNSEEGFETGFAVKENSSGSSISPTTTATTTESLTGTSPKKDGPHSKTDPSSKTWLTFGEDEDF
jgi:hypothetical protein